MRQSLILAGAVSIIGAASCDDAKSNAADKAPESEPAPASEPAPLGGAAKRGWEFRRAEPCHFEVAVPWGAIAPQPDPRVLGQVASEDEDGRVAVLASCADMGKVPFDADLLEVSVRGVVAGLGGKDMSSKPIEYAYRLGVEASGKVAAEDKPAALAWEGPLFYDLRVLVSGGHQYQLLMLSAEDDDDLAKDWLDSLRFGPDAPRPTPPDKWTRRGVGGWTIDAPGDATPARTLGGIKEGLSFEGNRGETGYSASLWEPMKAPDLDTAYKRLMAHFTYNVATKHTKIESEMYDDKGTVPWLEVVFRIEMPVPDHIGADNPTAAKVVRDVASARPLTYRMRMFEVDEGIIQLKADTRNRDDRVTWFLESLERQK